MVPTPFKSASAFSAFSLLSKKFLLLSLSLAISLFFISMLSDWSFIFLSFSSISLYLDFKRVSSASRSSSLSSRGITSPSITTLSSLISKLPDLTLEVLCRYHFLLFFAGLLKWRPSPLEK